MILLLSFGVTFFFFISLSHSATIPPPPITLPFNSLPPLSPPRLHSTFLSLSHSIHPSRYFFTETLSFFVTLTSFSLISKQNKHYKVFMLLFYRSRVPTRLQLSHMKFGVLKLISFFIKRCILTKEFKKPSFNVSQSFSICQKKKTIQYNKSRNICNLHCTYRLKNQKEKVQNDIVSVMTCAQIRVTK